MNEIVPLTFAPKLSNTQPINERLATEISQIKAVSTVPMADSKNLNNVLPPPIASVETIGPMREAIEKMIPN